MLSIYFWSKPTIFAIAASKIIKQKSRQLKNIVSQEFIYFQ